MSLIKSFNDTLKVKDPVELALESVANPQRDIARIAEYWRDVIEGKPEDFGYNPQTGSLDQMGEEKLLASIGNDLEMLEYSPEEVNQMISQVMQMVLES